METRQAEAAGGSVIVRPLRESDLAAADHIMRLAFGTFLGLPEPTAFMGDVDYVRTRWKADPAAAFGAEVNGGLVGSNFATRWGSVGFFGPLTVHPDYWEKGIATRLMEPVMEAFRSWGTTQEGLFTFAHSPKHIHLYQKFDFWPSFLTSILSKPVERPAAGARRPPYSRLSAGEREEALRACRAVTDAIYEGLDVTGEICAVQAQGLGDTVLLQDDAGLGGLAVCHCGPGTEAGSGACFVKFGAVRPGPNAGQLFDQLLTACEAFAAAQGLPRLVAGVNTARHKAYRQMLARGFRSEFQGVAMQRGHAPGYNRPEAYVMDDWR